MFKTLSEFYTSQEWRALRAQLIFERTGADGILRCEHSGQPLLHSYEIIAHHKTELTLQNVNDYSISLNPENIMLVSLNSHNEIHARFGYAQGKKVYYVYGAPCAGKNSFVNSHKGNSDLIVDIDAVWQALTGKKYYKPDALKVCAFQAYKCIYDMARMRQGKWQRAFIITGGAHKGQRERDLQELAAEPIYIDTDKQTCLERLSNDKERDHEQWKKYIDDWFEKYQA